VPGNEYASCEQVHDAHGDKISLPLNTWERSWDRSSEHVSFVFITIFCHSKNEGLEYMAALNPMFHLQKVETEINLTGKGRERDVWSLYKCRVKIVMLYLSLWERIDSLYWITSLLQSISSKWNAAVSQPWQPASHLMDKPITGTKPNEAQKAAMSISHYQWSWGQWLISFHTDHIRN
jgi:hypothetical protein